MIDSTQWLPRDIPVINKFRESKGDLEGRIEGDGKNTRITAAWSLNKTALDRLMDAGFLEMHHKIYAMSLLDLKRAYDARNGLRWCIVNGAEEANLSAGDAANCYDTVCVRIDRNISVHLIRAAEEFTNTDMPAEEANVFRKWFDRLVEIMDEEMKKRKEPLTVQHEYV